MDSYRQTFNPIEKSSENPFGSSEEIQILHNEEGAKLNVISSAKISLFLILFLYVIFYLQINTHISQESQDLLPQNEPSGDLLGHSYPSMHTSQSQMPSELDQNQQIEKKFTVKHSDGFNDFSPSSPTSDPYTKLDYYQNYPVEYRTVLWEQNRQKRIEEIQDQNKDNELEG